MTLLFAITAAGALLGLTFLLVVLGRKHPVVLIITGALLILPAAFTVFGFLASGELSAKEALPWRIGYGVFFFLFLGSALVLFQKARSVLRS